MEIKYLLETVEFGTFGVPTSEQAYNLLVSLYPEISNKEAAKKHIHRICKSHDDGTPFDLFDNKRSFAIGGFGSARYISISKIDEVEFRYVWLDLNTGEFSNSWSEEIHQKYVDSNMLETAKQRNFKLIKYQCLTDDSFELYDRMKIVSNATTKN